VYGIYIWSCFFYSDRVNRGEFVARESGRMKKSGLDKGELEREGLERMTDAVVVILGRFKF